MREPSADADLSIDHWSVRAIGELASCPGRVRGRWFRVSSAAGAVSVHAALEAAGEIPPLDAPGGEEAQEFIGRTDWHFRAEFFLDQRMLSAERIDFCAEVIDTLAEIRINGCRVATTASEYLPVRVPTRAWVRRGRNEIDIRVRGPVVAVESLERRLGSRPVNGDWTPFPFLRKCAADFGWDWGPRAPGVALVRPSVHAWTGTRIRAVRPLVLACDAQSATVEVEVEGERSGTTDRPVIAQLAAPEAQRELVTQASLELDERGIGSATMSIARPQRWWPRGYGSQPLYPLDVGATGCTRWRGAIGLRTAQLLAATDAHGRSFAFEVNGQSIWCRGANWIPPRPVEDGPWPEAIALLDAAAAAHLGMIRVWGGGRRRGFPYAHCDRIGLLVWQDFFFACATYPEEEPYRGLVVREAREQINALAAHPSVVLHCGGNENILAWWSWGWKERLRCGQSWGKRYWLEDLPRLTAALDPSRSYWPDSPYSGSMDRHPNDPDFGDRHTWDAKVEGYRSVVPRFCSEFGQQSPPTWGSVCELLRAQDRVVGAPILSDRQRAWGGDAFQYAPHLAERFAPVTRLDDWVYAAQLLQARAYSIAYQWLRANAPRSMGALVWQLNDAWTGHSWSVIDVRGRRKPAYFAIRQACAPQAISIIPADSARGGEVVLAIAHGEAGAEQPPGTVRVRLVDASGSAQLDERLELRMESPWIARAALPSACCTPRDPQHSLLVVDRGDDRVTHAFVHDRDATMLPPQFSVDHDGECWLIRAHALLRDVTLAAPDSDFGGDWEGLGDLERCAEDGFRTLLPGELWRVRVPGSLPGSRERAASCIRTANQIGRARG